MISLSILNKMILTLLSLCLLGGCQKNPKTTHVADTSLAADTAEVEYYNSTKAPEWTWREGIKMDAYLLTNDAEHTMESTILNGSDTATLSFWIKPSTNVPDLPLISVVNEQQEMMKLTNLTAREDGTLQGMALQMKAEGQEHQEIEEVFAVEAAMEVQAQPEAEIHRPVQPGAGKTEQQAVQFRNHRLEQGQAE